MPCYKGIAVSIHANGQISEYGVVKQSRVSRVTSYIPVPEPTLNPDTNAQEPAKFAISITLLTKGLAIPYSTPNPTPANPNPKPRIVGSPDQSGSVTPYIPLTPNENETIAAYIYFDGRAKEEVATLLRPGEETWVNSRWVQVPDSEGGGLAEREFLFREVSLERWLNGLDLTGHDAADKIEKRRQKYERKQRRQEKAAAAANSGDSPMKADLSNDDDSSASSDDEIPESTGQIKVAMFRVIASGEIKKGEYSPQFNAHDDDDDAETGNQNGGAGAVNADVEHTTSFAKPKTLDPKTISTQTVTGIDGPDKPYATFTFFYRGKRQLEKMGLLSTTPKAQATPSSAAKRRSTQIELPKLGPLKTGGTVGFSTFRDQGAESARRRKSRKKSIGGSPAAMDADSDSDQDDDLVTDTMQDIDEKDIGASAGKMSPEESKFSGELADGVERIHLKRGRSADPDSTAGGALPVPGFTGSLSRDSPRGTPPIPGGLSSTPPGAKTLPGDIKPPPYSAGPSATAIFGGSNSLPDESVIGSPLKKHRPSLQDEQLSRAAGLGGILAQVQGGGPVPNSNSTKPGGPLLQEQPPALVKEEIEEEL